MINEREKIMELKRSYSELNEYYSELESLKRTVSEATHLKLTYEYEVGLIIRSIESLN